jgi:hypothetical protein
MDRTNSYRRFDGDQTRAAGGKIAPVTMQRLPGDAG